MTKLKRETATIHKELLKIKRKGNYYVKDIISFIEADRAKNHSKLVEALRQANMTFEILENKYNLSGLTSSIDLCKKVYKDCQEPI